MGGRWRELGDTAWYTWKVLVSSECKKVFLNTLTVVQTVKKYNVNTTLTKTVLVHLNSCLHETTLKYRYSKYIACYSK